MLSEGYESQNGQDPYTWTWMSAHSYLRWMLKLKFPSLFIK